MKNVNETKLEAINLVKELNNSEVDDLIKNAQKVLNFVEYYVGDCPGKLEEKKEKFVDVVDRRLNQYNYTDPLRKEYVRHAIILNYIDKRLKAGIKELCEKIDDEIGEEYTTRNPEYRTGEKIGEIFLKGLVPGKRDGNFTESEFSSGDYVSPSINNDAESLSYKPPFTHCYDKLQDKEELQKSCKEAGYKSKIVLTNREEVDKKLLSELNEKVQEDIQSAKNNHSSTRKSSNRPLVDSFMKEKANSVPLGITVPDDFKNLVESVLEKVHQISISDEHAI
jgi:hypothetical protein